MQQDVIIILDLGCTENSRIARAVRSLGVYSEIHPHDMTRQQLSAVPNLKGMILAGGSNNTVCGAAVRAPGFVYSLGVPVLSIDYAAEEETVTAALPSDEAGLTELLEDFVLKKCGARRNWNADNFIADQLELIKKQVGDSGKVLLALSGGVDSAVVAALLARAIGSRLTCVFVDHGLMRKGEGRQISEVFGGKFGANLVCVDASERFLGKLEGVSDPEQKRKIIGGEFIRVFEEEARKLSGISFLAQGTIYPDIVESGTKTSKTIKSHHNVGGLPKDMKLELVEPLKYLFKDEVRQCGKALGLPDSIVYRQPFPGPGLGVRCLGAITRDRLEILREADAVLREKFSEFGLDKKVWQYFTVIPEFRSVGIKNGARCFEYPVIVRAVNTSDAMTAEIEELPWKVMNSLTKSILERVEGVNRVLYDLTPKPPATIEWE